MAVCCFSTGRTLAVEINKTSKKSIKSLEMVGGCKILLGLKTITDATEAVA